MSLQLLVRGCFVRRLSISARSGAAAAFGKDQLLYSSQLEDVFDSSNKRNTRRLVDQEVIRVQRENEQLRRMVEAGEKSNLSVALPFLYPGAASVNTGCVQDGTIEVPLEGIEAAEEENHPVVYPFAIFQKPDDKRGELPKLSKGDGLGRRVRRGRGNTTTAEPPDFEVLGDEDPEQARKLLGEDAMFRYGSADPDVAASKIPCGSCGALLHCQDPKMPGFTPAELFRGKSERQLRTISCQRCHVMREYNVALKLSVAPDHYAQALRHLHLTRAIVLLVVDLLDFPGSVWPDILDLLGPNKRIILVGNKVDLLPQDSTNYLQRIEKSMRKVFLEKCNRGAITYDPHLVSSMLVSARTGFNVENLINMIYTSWKESRATVGADIYLVGTTNVGKSSLFNSLLESDLCKINAIDCVEKAMTSPVPGTTLNLLKFPVMRPDPSRINMRVTRLRKDKFVFNRDERKRIDLLRQFRDRKYSVRSAPVGMTFGFRADKYMPLTGGLFDLSPAGPKGGLLPTRLDPTHPDFADGRWCYDTPGTVSHDQIINLLTQDEVVKMIPDLPLIPRSFCLRNGQSLFIAGLARLDLVDGPFAIHPVVVTVFCSDHLPINIVRTIDADDFYNSTLGTELLQVPGGASPTRLKEFPALECQELEVDGVSIRQSSCDVVLSSAGWVSLAPNVGQFCKIRAWTPGGKGIYLRDPPFLPFAHLLRGKRIRGTPAFKNDGIFIPN